MFIITNSLCLVFSFFAQVALLVIFMKINNAKQQPNENKNEEDLKVEDSEKLNKSQRINSVESENAFS